MTLEALRSDGGESQGHPAEEITAEQTLRARAAYVACVDQLDEIIGDFLAVLERDGLLDNTVIVYTSDHGELAGEHGLWVETDLARSFCPGAADRLPAGAPQGPALAG